MQEESSKSNDKQWAAHKLALMEIINAMGAATLRQLRDFGPVTAKSLTTHLEALVKDGYVEKLGGRRYFAGKSGRLSEIYRLADQGAAFLRSNGHSDAHGCGLTGLPLDHALAVLDVRLALLASHKDAKVHTDETFDYEFGSRNVRPDNMVAFVNWIIVETEEEPGLERVIKKLLNLEAYLTSWEGLEVEHEVRIVYLWDESIHDQSLRTWLRAYRAALRKLGQDSLSFSLHFLAHKTFLASPTLDLADYSPLPLTDPEEDNAEPPVLLDELVVFLQEVSFAFDGGIRTSAQEDDLIDILQNFLDTHSAARRMMVKPLRRLSNVFNSDGRAAVLEDLALGFFAGVHLPAHLDDLFETRRTAPVIIDIMMPGSRPRLSITLTPGLDYELEKANQDAKLPGLFNLFFALLVQYRHRLKLGAPKKRGSRS